MAVRNLGRISLDQKLCEWIIDRLEPHACIKLKSIFPKISKGQSVPFTFSYIPENCHDLKWFMERYPLEISRKDWAKMCQGSNEYKNTIDQVERIVLPNYNPKDVRLKEGKKARPYQLVGTEVHQRVKRLLNSDDLGLGKTLTSILSFFNPKALPGLVVVQTHLAEQWKTDGIEQYTDLKAYIIKGTKPYDLPKADVYIIRYSCIAGWVDLLSTGFFKYVIFDEVQELRHNETKKYNAALCVSSAAQFCQGLSASPIYNYGDEIFNIMEVIKPGSMGQREEFLREWCVPIGNGKYKVQETVALGSYLRESFLMIKRSRKDVGMQLPEINKIVHTVGFDSDEVKRSEDIAKQLAIKVVRGTSFMERGEAAREFDIYMRQQTGIAKAREVASYVSILLESGEPVVLAGWHREVYRIWMETLRPYNPVLYTGSESPKQKREAYEAFTTGQTNLFIISLRSGAGLDGLQKRCKYVVIGELDYSPKVHDQLIGRVDRPGQENQVTVVYLKTDWGSDPPIISLLGLKASQSHGIIDLGTELEEQHTDVMRVKYMAQEYLKRRAIS
jgi:SNF2 family DNA or RNA helicase